MPYTFSYEYMYTTIELAPLYLMYITIERAPLYLRRCGWWWCRSRCWCWCLSWHTRYTRQHPLYIWHASTRCARLCAGCWCGGTGSPSFLAFSTCRSKMREFELELVLIRLWRLRWLCEPRSSSPHHGPFLYRRHAGTRVVGSFMHRRRVGSVTSVVVRFTRVGLCVLPRRRRCRHLLVHFDVDVHGGRFRLFF